MSTTKAIGLLGSALGIIAVIATLTIFLNDLSADLTTAKNGIEKLLETNSRFQRQFDSIQRNGDVSIGQGQLIQAGLNSHHNKALEQHP